MKMNRVLSLLILFMWQFAISQNLQYIAPLKGKGNKVDSATSFLLSTMDDTRFDDKIAETRPFTNSIQIVDADEPWPPRWYIAMPYYSNQQFFDDSVKNIRACDFLVDASVDHGVLSFFKSTFRFKQMELKLISNDISGYILLNKKFDAIDTVTNLDSKAHFFNWHDLRFNKNGERLLSIKIGTKLDLRKDTGNPADSAVYSDLDIIKVLNKDNYPVISFSLAEKLDPAEFKFNEVLRKLTSPQKNSDDAIDWTDLTSLCWDYDGNIIYTMRYTSMGKISREDGSVLWHFAYKDLPVINGQDTLQWFYPQDFKLVSETDTTVTYSLLSLGKGDIKAQGIIFSINKKTSGLHLIASVKPKISLTTEGGGSFDFLDKNNYMFCLGSYNDTSASTPDEDKYEIQYTVKGNTTLYKVPAKVSIDKAHKLNDFPRPDRPIISYKDNTLQVPNILKNIVWYRLDGAELQKATSEGAGNSIKPKAGVTYCAEADYGVGRIVSRPYTFAK